MTKSEFFLYHAPFVILFLALLFARIVDDGQPPAKIVTQKDRGVNKEDVWIFVGDKLIGVKEKVKQ